MSRSPGPPAAAGVGERPAGDPTIAIEVAYAEPSRQTVIALDVPHGTTAAEAVARSRIRERHPGIPEHATLGVHGRIVAATQPLADGDRVELYRPLPADPKETRRRLAREGRTMGTHGRRARGP